MTENQLNLLYDVIDGNNNRHEVGFIIDSPWLPGWYNISIMDYYTSDELWFSANKKAADTFPDVIFLPGFWSEYGMCTEPSAFGARCIFPQNNFPNVEKLLYNGNDLGNLVKPNPTTDGLLPFVINRLKIMEDKVFKLGHVYPFAISRGPLNIASFLLGTTEFLMLMKLETEKTKNILQLITDFICDWLEYQLKTFPTMNGIMILDDIVGFIGKEDFTEYAYPSLKQIFNRFPVKIKFFHNDAQCKVCAPFLHEIGINMLNFGIDTDMNEMRNLCGPNVALVGNIPPRDVLASGTPDEVRESVRSELNMIKNDSRVIMSCGGGMPPGVTNENLKAFIDEVKNIKRPF
jgi:uroporphyrinogen-III decarboxylase